MPEETPKPPATRTRAAKPRAGIQRKTREEREQFAKQEAERQQARNAEAAKSAGPRGGIRGGRGGRGGRAGASAAGPGDSRARDALPGSGGGVFGVGSGLRATRVKTLSEGYSEMVGDGQSSRGLTVKTTEGEESGVGGGGGGGGSGSGGRSTTKASREVNDIDIASDDDRDEDKQDIELIYVSSDEDNHRDEDDDAVVSAKRKQKALRRTPRGVSGLRPVRAPRAPREEDEYNYGARDRSNRALKKSESDMHDNEDADENAMDLDDQSALSSSVRDHPPLSAEARRRNFRKSGTKSRDARIAAETMEERAERERVAKDTDKLRHIFVRRQSSRRSATVEVADGVAEEEEEETKHLDEADEDEPPSLEDGKYFLFQLPPLTPFLYDPSTEPPPEPPVKQEPGTGDINTAASAPSTSAAISAAPGIKKEPSTTIGTGTDAPTPTTNAKPPLQLDGLMTAAEPTRLPAGLVGKLRVHKSGKVSLDWGGTDMEVRYGTEVDFLQDAVLVETKKEVGAQQQAVEKEKGKDENGNSVVENAGESEPDAGLDLRAGRGFALGQVRKKMVLIPDWAKLYD